MDVRGLKPLGVVHQLVRAMNKLRGELSRHAAPLRYRPQAQADHPDVHADGTRRQAAIVARPVVRFDRPLEPLGDLDGFAAAGQIGNEEAELVPAEPRVQIAGFAALYGEEVLRPDLVRENPSDALDDAIAHRVAERVVVPLEA